MALKPDVVRWPQIDSLPDAMNTQGMALRRKVGVRATGDTRLYVRVQQEDGHRMWSSPLEPNVSLAHFPQRERHQSRLRIVTRPLSGSTRSSSPVRISVVGQPTSKRSTSARSAKAAPCAR